MRSDGSVLALQSSGYRVGEAESQEVVLWTAAGSNPLGIAGTGYLLSSDGSLVVGIRHTRFELRAFRGGSYWTPVESFPFTWTPSEGTRFAWPALGPVGVADMSIDGRLFAGTRGEQYQYTNDTIVWDIEGRVVRELPLPDGVVENPPLSAGGEVLIVQVVAMSDDGSVVVGHLAPRGDSEGGTPLRWDDTGVHEVSGVEGMGPCRLWDLSADGRVAVGECMQRDPVRQGSWTRAVVWADGRAEALPLPVDRTSYCRHVSADGTTVAGHFFDEEGSEVGYTWTRSDGVRTLATLAASAGHASAFDDAWRQQISGLSSDGRVVAGWTVGSDFRNRPFRLELPSDS